MIPKFKKWPDIRERYELQKHLNVWDPDDEENEDWSNVFFM